MKSVFVKEQKDYTKYELEELLKKAEAVNTKNCIQKLKGYGILKTVRKTSNKDFSDLQYEEIIVDEDDNETEWRYKFVFVGVIIVDGLVIKCYPKYITKKEPDEELKKVFRVLEKFESNNQVIKLYSNENKQGNRLSILLYLLHDYYENGLYSNEINIIETNGNGDIFWDRTINNTFPIINDGNPYYVELQTRKRINDDYDYIKRLHECVLSLCSKELKQTSLLDLFGLDELQLSDEPLDDFGERDYISSRIEKEISVQFNTRKLYLLNVLLAYVKDETSINDLSSFTLYGTNSFHVVWEKVCGEVFNNCLNKKIEGKELYKRIPVPIWTKDCRKYKPVNNKTLVPDIVTISNNEFIILDAKYYNMSYIDNDDKDKRHVENSPGVGDIDKQFLYELAFKEFTNNRYNKIKNYFLMPGEGEKVVDYGVSTVDYFENLNVDLAEIRVRKLPADKIYDLYLSGKKLSVKYLEIDHI